MFKALSVSLLFIYSHYASSSTCKLNSNRTLKIGCTVNCGGSVEKSLRKYASKLNYQIEILNMSKLENQNNLSKVDGIVIPGGEDIDPVHYKYSVEEKLRRRIEELDYLVEYTHSGKVRDKFELDLLKSYFSNNQNTKLPILGICRGMQILAVSQNIPLYIDIKTETNIANRRNLEDEIFITEKQSLIYRLLKSNDFTAYKFHHQGIRVSYFEKHQLTRWPYLNITAFSNNHLIAEVLEFADHPIMGVQFHPEEDRGVLREKIFTWILEESCKNKKSPNQ